MREITSLDELPPKVRKAMVEAFRKAIVDPPANFAIACTCNSCGKPNSVAENIKAIMAPLPKDGCTCYPGLAHLFENS